jgi:hypothetical protein
MKLGACLLLALGLSGCQHGAPPLEYPTGTAQRVWIHPSDTRQPEAAHVPDGHADAP